MDDLSIGLLTIYIIGFFIIPILAVMTNSYLNIFKKNDNEENYCRLFSIAFLWPIFSIIGFFSLLI